MNDAIFLIKRDENASLSYTGMDKHAGEDISGWDTMVQHKVFGAGKVIELGGGMITVAFEQGQKRFEFPSAFEKGFLKG